MVDRFERFSVAIAEISRYWHKIASKEMESRGLRGVHSIYLTALYRHPEGLTAGQLCELCGRDKADASRMLSIMEKRGMVRKEGGHRNLYGGKLKLTDEGVAAAKFVCRRAGLAVELAGSALDESARAILYESLEQIASNLREIAQNGLPDFSQAGADLQQKSGRSPSEGAGGT